VTLTATPPLARTESEILADALRLLVLEGIVARKHDVMARSHL